MNLALFDSKYTVTKQKGVISIVIIDDNYEFRHSLKNFLNLYSNHNLSRFKIIADTESLAEGKMIINKYQPEILLLDLKLQKQWNLDIFPYLSENNYHTKTLVLSDHKEKEIIFKAMILDAKGYIFKSNIVTQLPEAINRVLNSEIYLPPEVATRFFLSFKDHIGSDYPLQFLQGLPNKNYHLTPREKEVLKYLMQGLSNKEIALELFVTNATVKAHLGAIFGKLCVKNRTQAIVMAIKENIVI